MKKLALISISILLVLIGAGCESASAGSSGAASQDLTSAQTSPSVLPQKSQEAPPTAAPLSAATLVPSPTSTQLAAPQFTSKPTAAATSTPLPTLKPDEWERLPVVPAVSAHVLEIYRRGIELGNNPQAFSKLGDCGSTPAWFLGDFDRGSRYYRLGPYSNLEGVIQQYQGSFGRTSLAARSGFNVSALFTPLWSDRTYCNAGEAPIECEYRVQKPIIAFIMLGTNDVWRPEEFEPQMRRAIEYSIQSGVIPILATKADNQEGDGSINATIARLAREYDIPLWNYWAAVNALPNHGLQEDNAHLTWGRNLFDDPDAMTKAWPVRNLTALQVLDAVWRKIQTGI